MNRYEKYTLIALCLIVQCLLAIYGDKHAPLSKEASVDFSDSVLETVHIIRQEVENV